MNAKKTWEGIREILNVSKKNRSMPNKLTVGNSEIFDSKTISEKFNDFFLLSEIMWNLKFLSLVRHFVSI